jgi:hypothetical protein
MSLIDDLLKPSGVKYEDLTPEERQTLHTWVEVLQKGAINVEKLKEYIARMKEAVEDKISKEPPFKRIFIFKIENKELTLLQARLRNYLLLEAFLSTPERAKKQLEAMISGLSEKK